MSKDNPSQFKNKILSISKFLLLITFCVLASIVLVWPLWKISTGAPKIYTAVVLSLLGIGVIVFIVSKIRKSNWLSVLKFFVNLLIIGAGLFFSVKYVLFEKKLIALICFISMFLLLILFNYLLSRIRHE